MAMTVSLAFVGTASAAVLYQDSFTRTGLLNGTAPDVTNTGGNLWQQTFGDFSQGTATYVTNGASVGQNGAAIDGSSYLAVNGGSGVTLNGTVDFTLSATVTNTGGQNMGIALNTAVYQGGSQFNGTQAGVFAIVGFSSANSSCADPSGVLAFGATPGATATTVSIIYSASGSTLKFMVGPTLLATKTGVTAANIAALTFVSIDNGSFGNNPTAQLDNFTLQTAVPEPSTYAMMLGGLGGLTLVLRRRLRHS